MDKQSGGFYSRLKNLILPDEKKSPEKVISNNAILEEILNCFDESCRRESVGTSLLFNTHFLVILHPDTYEDRLASFPVIVKEAVKAFYKRLQVIKKDYEEITPVSSNWQFRFGPGKEFNNENIEPQDVRVIGMLTGMREMKSSDEQSKNATTRVTMRSKATNVYDRMDINLQALRFINFMQNGTFTVKFSNELELGSGSNVTQALQVESGLARIECFIADKQEEQVYVMRDKEIVIARKEPENEKYGNYFLVDSPYVSNPHARIRYNETTGGFQIASFSRNETRVNEAPVTKSEPANPQWFELTDSSQILLNALVTLKFKIIRQV
jgi:hypothetical protein